MNQKQLTGLMHSLPNQRVGLGKNAKIKDSKATTIWEARAHKETIIVHFFLTKIIKTP